MSDISVKLIVKRGFIVCIISKKKKRIRYVTPRYVAYDRSKETCMRTDATVERRVKGRKKDGKGGART